MLVSMFSAGRLYWMIKDARTLDLLVGGGLMGVLAVLLGGILITLHNVQIEVAKDTFYLEPCLIPPPIYKDRIIYKKFIVTKEKPEPPSKVLAYGSSECIRAYHACATDKGCHAMGCTELIAYYQGLQGLL